MRISDWSSDVCSSMLMDILGGVFTGAAYAGDVANQFLDFERPQNAGHFFLALRPGLFVSADDFRSRMDRLVQRVHAVPTAEGFEEILMRSEEHTSELQSLMRISYAVFCLK